LKNGDRDPLVWMTGQREPMMNMQSHEQVMHLLTLLDSGTVKEAVQSMIQQADQHPKEVKSGNIELFIRDYVNLNLVVQVQIQYSVNGHADPHYSFIINKSVDLLTSAKMTESEMGLRLLNISEEKAASVTNGELATLVEEMKVLFVPGVHAVFNEAAKRLRK
jgi:hypothetical protein